ncbi:glycosyltransferase [Gracilibacillus timonensis]|uniref:glycosyltransferase n=1 Tax=Gracilibacillus timonensis TaxID=1816696 RepID=UPI00082712E0|nr:glycosyltransferase [Gracilibacillus timonensis]
MYALVIGRAYPDKKTGMMGIFEYEQAVAINKYGFKTIYSFCDTRSIKSLRKFNHVKLDSSEIPVYGYHLPIGGTPRKIFDSLKFQYNKKILNQILKDHGKPSVIHVHFPLLNLNKEVWGMLRNLNVPIVVTEHWTKVQNKSIESYRVDLLKQIVEETNTFICVGEPLRKSVVDLTGTNKEIKVVPNMVKPNFYYQETIKDKKTFDFITVGRLVEVKRFGLAIEAFTKAFKNDDRLRMHIVGDGPLFDKLKKQIIDYGMKDRIIMHGFLSREKTAEILQNADVFFSASILETFGVPFIEAMACGKPVIGVENGPIDVYINEHNGVLVEKDNLKEMTSVLRKVYNDRKYYTGKKISNLAQKIFSEKSIAKELINIYNDTELD